MVHYIMLINIIVSICIKYKQQTAKEEGRMNIIILTILQLKFYTL